MTPILAGAVDTCSCQNFFSLLWFLFCLQRPLVSSLSKSPAGLKNSIQVILFFHFTSFTIFWGWSSILRPRTLSESELEDYIPISISQKCFHQILFSLRWFFFCFLEGQESFPGWTRRTFKKQGGEWNQWMRRTGRFTGLHFLPSIRVRRTGENRRLACSG